MRRLSTFLLMILLLAALAVPVTAQTTTEELLAGMVTEEVEPGVYRVLSDGVRTLEPGSYLDLVAGHDGGTWLTRQDGFFRLGSDGVHKWPSERGDLPWDDGDGTPPWHDFEVTADGTVWAAMAIETDTGPEYGPSEGDPYLLSYDGDEWASRLPTYLLDGPIEIISDGTLWAVWLTDSADYDSGVLGYLGADGWTAVGEWPYLGSSPYVSDEGEVWAFGGAQMMDLAVHHFIDGAWRDDGPSSHGPADVGSDGTVWAIGSDGGVLLRFDGTDWTTFAGPSGAAVENESHDDLWGPSWSDVRVAPDGSIWAAAMRGWNSREEPICSQGLAGVVHFDGVTWSRHLSDLCVDGMDIAADGSLWVLADDGLYVITPEAMAGKE